MIKKILGVGVVAVFAGVPFFAMAAGTCTVSGIPPFAANDAASCAGIFVADSSTAVSSYAYQFNVGSCPNISELFTDPNGESVCNAAITTFNLSKASNIHNVDSICRRQTSKQRDDFLNTQSNSPSCAAVTADVLPTRAGTADALPLSVAVHLTNPIKCSTFSGLVALVTKTAVEILMPFVVLAFIWSGFLFVRAQGKDEALTEAKKAITWSIIGAFILMGAWGFAQIISTTVSGITGTTSSSGTGTTDNCQ